LEMRGGVLCVEEDGFPEQDDSKSVRPRSPLNCGSIVDQTGVPCQTFVCCIGRNFSLGSDEE
jgi:hypothetical protein